MHSNVMLRFMEQAFQDPPLCSSTAENCTAQPCLGIFLEYWISIQWGAIFRVPGQRITAIYADEMGDRSILKYIFMLAREILTLQSSPQTAQSSFKPL
jgi:hypothetical protein